MMRETCVFAVSGERNRRCGDLVVREALPDEAQHLGLALGETVEARRVGGIPHPDRGPLEQPTRDAGREQRVAARRRRARRG